MKKYKKRIIKAFIIFIAVLLLLPVIVYGILYFFILPPQKLTPLVVDLVNERIDARFECNEIELTFFSTYPNIGIRINGGCLFSDVARDTVADDYYYRGEDTLLVFKNCEVSFGLIDYLRKNEITINNIVLDSVGMYGYVNTQGKANWEIIKSTDTVDTTATDTLTKPLPPINLTRLQIKNANLGYYNRTQRLYTAINGLSLDVKGNLVADTNFLDIDAEWKRFRYYSKEYSLQNSLDLKLNTQLQLSNNYNHFKFPEAKLLVNQIPFSIKGEIYNYTDSSYVDIDVEYELNVPNIESLLTFVPKKYLEGHNLKTKGEVYLAGTVKGIFDNENYPVIKSKCQIKDAYLHSDKSDYNVEEMALDMDVSLDMADNKQSYINLNKARVKSQHFFVDIEAKLNNLLTNPLFDGKIKADINFTELSKQLMASDTIRMQGKVLADIETRFTLNDITSGNYGKIQSVGELDVSGFKLESAPYGIDVLLTKAKMTMTSERKIENVANGARMLNGKIYVDSLNLKYGNNINTNVKNLYVSLSTPAIPDTSGIVPVTGRVSFDKIRTQLPDSVWVRAGKTEIKGGLLPSSTNKKTPVIVAIVSSDTLVYLMRQIHSGILFTNSAFDMRLSPYVAQTQNRQRVINDSVMRQRRTRTIDSTIVLTGTSSTLLSKLEASGKLNFDKMRLWSPYFPIRIEMLGSNLKFTSNDITLSNARLNLGKSDFLLNGKITNIRRALLRGGKLSAELTTESDNVNCDELIDAIAKGMAYGENENTHVSQMDINNLDDIQNLAQVSEADTVSGVFVLPGYLNLSLNTKAKQITYKHVNLKNTNGQLILRNQAVQLTNFYSQSNIGQGGISMFYSARSKKEASMGIDVDMKGILVDRFIDLAPSMDTLLPMLKSFEGTIDCQMVATCMLDSTSSVVLPSLQAACYLRGKDLVLLDGETFAEISKKLMFKNKKRNMIDSIAVDLTVKESEIEIYPFLIELDRYRLGVGGNHNLDMSFSYHISVLKSPVPFKLGVDVIGTIEDFKYKIVKCRYKEMFKSAKTGTIDTTRLNVRREIYHAIQERIKSNLNNNYRGRQFSQMLKNNIPADSLATPVADLVNRREDTDTLQ